MLCVKKDRVSGCHTMHSNRRTFLQSIAIAFVVRNKNGVERLSRVALNKMSREGSESQRESE